MQNEYKINPEDMILKPIDNDKYMAKIGLHLAGAMILNKIGKKKKEKRKERKWVGYREGLEFVINDTAMSDIIDVITGLQYVALTSSIPSDYLIKKTKDVITMIAKTIGYEEEENGTQA